MNREETKLTPDDLEIILTGLYLYERRLVQLVEASEHEATDELNRVLELIQAFEEEISNPTLG